MFREPRCSEKCLKKWLEVVREGGTSVDGCSGGVEAVVSQHEEFSGSVVSGGRNIDCEGNITTCPINMEIDKETSVMIAC